MRCKISNDPVVNINETVGNFLAVKSHATGAAEKARTMVANFDYARTHAYKQVLNAEVDAIIRQAENIRHLIRDHS